MLSSQNEPTSKRVKIPASYMCSITGQIMIDPVITADGQTYEREAIEKWLATHDTSPKTGQKLKHKELIPNWDKKSDISEFLDEHPELYEGDEVYLSKTWIEQLTVAIKDNQIKLVQELLSKDTRLLTFKLEGEYTAFHLACEFGSPELADILLENLYKKKQLDKMKTVPVGFEPVHLNALLEKTLEKLDKNKLALLLTLGAELEQIEWSSKNTLLHRLAIQGKLDAIKWLLEQKVSLEDRNADGNTPLLLALINKHTRLAQFLLDNEADLEVKNSKQQTPLFIAIVNRDIESVNLLLEKGANPTVVCGFEQLTPLHIIAEHGDLAMLKLLLQTDAKTSINSLNSNGDTPLHLAAKFGQDSLITPLLEAGASSKIKNHQSQTPIELAREQHKDKAANLIEQMAKTLKQAKLEKIETLEKLVKEQSTQIGELKKAFKREKKEREALQTALEQGKKVAIEHFYKLKKSSKQAVTPEHFYKLKKSSKQAVTPPEPWIQCLSALTRDTVKCLQPLPNSKLVGGLDSGIIAVWDLNTGYCSKSWKGHTSTVSCLQLLPSGELVSGSHDQTIKVWNLSSGECITTLQCSNWVTCLQLLPNGELVSGELDGAIKVWNLDNTSYPKKTLQEKCKFQTIYLSLLPNGELVSGARSGTVKVFDLGSGACLSTFDNISALLGTSRESEYITSLRLLPSGELVSGSSCGNIWIQDSKSGDCLKRLPAYSRPIKAITSFHSLPGGELVSSSMDGTIKVWALNSGKCKTLQVNNDYHGVACLHQLPSGELISGEGEGVIKVWPLSEFLPALDTEVETENELSNCCVM